MKKIILILTIAFCNITLANGPDENKENSRPVTPVNVRKTNFNNNSHGHSEEGIKKIRKDTAKAAQVLRFLQFLQFLNLNNN